MVQRSSPGSRWTGFVVVLLLLCVGYANAQDSLIQGDPLSIDLVLQYSAKRATPKNRRGLRLEVIVEAIRNRKVTFIATPENIGRLQQAAVPEEIIAAVREVAPVPPPPPPPVVVVKPETGSLAVTCVPAECSVMVESGRVAPTTNGTYRTVLPVGRCVVVINKAGYTSVQRSVELTKAGAEISVELKPDAATMSTFGGGLAKKMLDVLGDDGIDVKGSGSWTVQKLDAAPIEWTFAVKLGPTESVFAILKSPDGVYEIQCRGQSCQPRRPTLLRGKALKPDQAAAIQDDLRIFRRFYLANLLPLWRSAMGSALYAQAETDQMMQDRYRFRLAGPDDVYDIELDHAFLPVQVAYSSKLVGGTPTIVTYSDYVGLGKLRYPKQTTIKLPEQTSRAIQIRLDSLDISKGP